MEIGAAIRHTREGLGLKLETVAMEAGFDAGNLSRIETGKQQPTIARLQNIARAMQVSVADLFNMIEPTAATDSRHALHDSETVSYNDDLQVIRRGYTTLDAHHRRTVVEFIKMLNRLQRDDN